MVAIVSAHGDIGATNATEYALENMTCSTGRPAGEVSVLRRCRPAPPQGDTGGNRDVKQPASVQCRNPALRPHY